jgi:hypothetical protein
VHPSLHFTLYNRLHFVSSSTQIQSSRCAPSRNRLRRLSLEPGLAHLIHREAIPCHTIPAQLSFELFVSLGLGL